MTPYYDSFIRASSHRNLRPVLRFRSSRQWLILLRRILWLDSRFFVELVAKDTGKSCPCEMFENLIKEKLAQMRARTIPT